jgi:hypothetical protein
MYRCDSLRSSDVAIRACRGFSLSQLRLTPADELYQQMKAAFDSEVKSSKHLY